MKIKKILGIATLSIFLLGACSAENKQASIRGRITITSALAPKVNPSDAVYVFAFSPGSASDFNTQIPLTVKKITPAVFPLDYQLTQDDIPFPEKRLEGSFFLMARVDKDGNAKTISKGDLEGFYKKNPALVGSRHVNILINKEIP